MAYRSHHSATQNVVVRWVRGVPAEWDECWFPTTSPAAGPARIGTPYAKRVTIEEPFRDAKNKRRGQGPRDTNITRADRLDRPLLVVALADLLLYGVELVALRTCRPGRWAARSKNDCSVFTVGRLMIARPAPRSRRSCVPQSKPRRRRHHTGDDSGPFQLDIVRAGVKIRTFRYARCFGCNGMKTPPGPGKA